MARITKPLFGDSASGTLADLITFRTQADKATATPKSKEPERQSAAQRAQNEYYQQAHAAWMQLPTTRVKIKGHYYDRRTPDWKTFFRAWPPPSAPINLAISAIDFTTLTLSWVDTSTHEDGFKLERKTGTEGTWSQITTTGKNITTWQDTGLAVGVTYYYRIRAYNVTGNSNYSNEANATTLSISAPTAPTTLTATALPNAQISLTWTDTSNNEDGFRIDRKTGTGGTWGQIATVGANTTTYLDTGLTSGATYYYRVRAYNAGGNSSYCNEAYATAATVICILPIILGQTINDAWSEECTSTHRANRYAKYYTFTLEASSTVTILQTSAIDGYMFLLSGTGSGGSIITQDDDSGGNYNPKIIKSLTNGNYTIEATTYAAYKTGTFSISLTGPLPPNGTPSNLTATAAGGSKINLAWTDNSTNEDGFKLERKTGIAGTWTQIATTAANTTTYQNTGLTQGTTYYYRVKAYTAVGDSAYSNEANATTATVQCIFPITLGQTISDSWISDCASTHRSGRYAKYYTFTLATSTTVTINVTSSIDGYMYLLSGTGSSGTIITEDDDSGGNRNPRIIRTLDAGDYTIEVTTYSANATGNFSVQLTG